MRGSTIFQRLITFQKCSLSVETNSEIIVNYLDLEYGDYQSSPTRDVIGRFSALESEDFDSLIFPAEAHLVWQRPDGCVTYKDGLYYGLYHHGLVKGIYNTQTNEVTNLIRDPSQYFNICVGVIDYLFSKALLKDGIFRVHAACVAKGTSGYLICGAKSSGKTTLLMRLLRDGYDFIADDATYIEFKGRRLICHPFPKTIKINLEDLNKFFLLYKDLMYSPILTSDGTRKAIIKLRDNNFSVMDQRLPITQILIPSIGGNSRTSSQPIKLRETKTGYCISVSVKKHFNRELLIPSFRGADLLSIDYITNQELIKQQETLCENTLQNYHIKILQLGTDLENIHFEDVF
ncbi:MAG: hypothetical protein EU536_01050 [Promethearchaeota archaeon]|nr:MAG: hypothetical protein EU536_01050 [Candidatus Lokiarchaeota archaeon]